MESAVESLASSSKCHKTSKKIIGRQYDYEGHRKVIHQQQDLATEIFMIQP